MIKSEDAIKNRTHQKFKDDLYVAQRAEKALAAWIDKQGSFKEVRGVNEKGYDIECLTKDSKVRKIEVKRDFWVDKYKDSEKGRRATNNICVELWSNFTAGNLGWIYYSDSDYIYYIGNEYIYIVGTARLRHVTAKLVEVGQANLTEPTLKATTLEQVAKVSYSAHYNGNHKVRNVLINKDFLIRTGCILKVIERESSGFNKIAELYQI